MRRHLTVLLAAALALTVVPATATAAPARPSAPAATPPAALVARQVNVKLITGGLSSPAGVVNAGDGTGRLFVIQQGGTVRVVKDNVLLSGNFLDIRGVSGGLQSGGEQGLLGLAFHPSFETNRKLFAYFNNGAGNIVLAEFTANAAGTGVAVGTFDPLLTISHPTFSNHNGGQLAFGPDGYLYVFVGDGGGGGDPNNRSQDVNSLLGKVLRIAPNLNGGYTSPGSNPYVGKTGHDSIWDLGLRNPWRASFDRANGNLWIADVGQDVYEEVNRESASSPGGVNYGWRCREGKHWYSTSGCDTHAPWPYVDPLVEYAHSAGNCSVTGGYVYRGSIQRDLAGHYVFGDYCSGMIWSVSSAASSSSIVYQRDTNLYITSFGEGENGELYLTDQGGGRLYRVVAPPFDDIVSSSFLDDIMWIFYEGITSGCGGGGYCPNQAVTREQMASFLSRAIGLPNSPTDYFTDDGASQHEADINKIARAGIAAGCDTSPPRFCPTANVTRGQMASFLTRALDLPATSTDYFDDDDGTTHEDAINSMAKAGITSGCGTRRYCPNSSVTRGQMAAFLRRAFET